MFPNLDSVKTIALDTETYNPGMKKLGSAARRGGYICGVSIATEDKSWYFSLNHPDSVNIPEDKFYHWLKTLENKNIIGANLTYDLDYLQYKGFKPKKRIIDILLAEPLIDENQFRFNLNSCSKKYLGEEKKEPGLLEFCERNNFKITSEHPAQSYIYKMPAYQVEEYAKADSELAYKVWLKQYPILQQQALLPVFDMESRLIPLMVQMKKTGVRIDQDKLEQNKVKYTQKLKTLKAELSETVGFNLNVNANNDIKKVFEKLKIPIVLTEKGNPSFSKDSLASCDHPIVEQILNVRHYEKIYSTYIGDIDKFIVKGRIHCQFNQLKSDDKGTVTGRFSSSLPNLQNQPARDKEAKKDIRSMFIPEPGYIWGRGDFSQIELRVLAHYARGPKAKDFLNRYIDNPNYDAHQFFANMTQEERSIVKSATFGVIYGSYPKTLARTLGVPLARGKQIFYKYKNQLPFIDKTMEDATAAAEKVGFVCTVLNRRRRFPIVTIKKEGHPDKKGRIGTYRSLNAVLQGSAGDIAKKALVNCYEAGILDVLPLHLIVHDEANVSIPDTKEGWEAWAELKDKHENAIKLKVPIVFDQETGPNWGECK